MSKEEQRKVIVWDVNISCDFKGVVFKCSEESLEDNIRLFIKTEILDGNSFDITVENITGKEETK